MPLTLCISNIFIQFGSVYFPLFHNIKYLLLDSKIFSLYVCRFHCTVKKYMYFHVGSRYLKCTSVMEKTTSKSYLVTVIPKHTAFCLNYFMNFSSVYFMMSINVLVFFYLTGIMD